MKYWIKIYLICIVGFGLVTGIDGQMTSSPYSMFGAGQVENSGFGTNRGMGGTGYAFLTGTSLNNTNPASYSGIDSLMFLFEVGIFSKLTSYHSKSVTNTKLDGNIEYLAVGFRLFPFWSLSTGITPFSSVGYKINSSDVIEGDLTIYNKVYEGNGGISNFYLGNSIKINRNLSLGVNFSYIFGTLIQSETGDAKDEFAGYYLENNISVHSWYINYGLQYAIERNGWKYSLGLIFGDSKRLQTSGEAIFNYLGDTSTVSLESEEINFRLPRKYGLGIGVTYQYKFRAGFDYERKDWSSIKFSNPLLITRNSDRVSIGLEYYPKRKLRDKGFKNIYYRLGAYYRKSYLKIDQTPINSKGITCGLGIPLKNNLSHMNLSFEYGTNGTTANGLIREDYWLLHFNISMRSVWFQKSKYD